MGPKKFKNSRQISPKISLKRKTKRSLPTSFCRGCRVKTFPRNYVYIHIHSARKGHWEIKGRFRKRVVLANVPSFRFSFRGINMRTYPRSGFRSRGTSECTLVRVFVQGEHPPKPPFWKPPFVNPRKGVVLCERTCFCLLSTF